MQPAHFKSLRESLGLTLAEVAALAGVGERTVVYWESDKTPPADVVAALKRLDASFEQAAHNALATYTDLADPAHGHGIPDDVVLYRYRESATLWAQHPEFKGLSTRVHAAMLWRVKHQLSLVGINASIEFID